MLGDDLLTDIMTFVEDAAALHMDWRLYNRTARLHPACQEHPDLYQRRECFTNIQPPNTWSQIAETNDYNSWLRCMGCPLTKSLKVGRGGHNLWVAQLHRVIITEWQTLAVAAVHWRRHQWTMRRRRHQLQCVVQQRPWHSEPLSLTETVTTTRKCDNLMCLKQKKTSAKIALKFRK